MTCRQLILEDAGLIVATMDEQTTDVLLKKVKTFALARSAGVPSPRRTRRRTKTRSATSARR
jgi:hypothetical protein